LIVFIDENVGGLEVPVKDTVLMSIMNGFSNGLQVPGGIERRQGPIPQQRCEILTCDQVHGKIMLSLVLTNLMDLDDVRVLQARDGFRLRPESLHLTLTGKAPAQDHLERDDPVQADLPGLVNDPHPAAGDFRQEFVISEVAIAAAWTWPAGRRQQRVWFA